MDTQVVSGFFLGAVGEAYDSHRIDSNVEVAEDLLVSGAIEIGRVEVVKLGWQ